MKHETKRLAIQDIVWKIKQVEIPQQNGQNLTKKSNKNFSQKMEKWT
jgi:hypothetical protein